MLLHLLWFLPACLFALRFIREQRSLFNAYLLSFTVLIFVLVTAGFTLVSLEAWLGRSSIFVVLAGLAAFIPFSVFFSSLYLLLNGRQMVTFEGFRLSNLLSLIYGLTILLTMGLHFLPDFRLLRPLIPLVDFFLLYTSGLYLSYILYGFFCNRLPVRKEPEIIIILGCGLLGDQIPPLLAQRLEMGKAFYEQFEKRPRLLVSGGKGSDETLAEAEAMAAYLIQAGIPEKDVLIEKESTTTQENMIFSKRILDKLMPSDYSCLVVTNSFHSLRSGIYMRQSGIKGRSIGSPTAPYYLPSAWLRETAGLILIYWKWHAILLGILLLPWLLSTIKSIFFF